MASPANGHGAWRLIECREDGQAPNLVPLSAAPLVVGRTAEASLSIPLPSISKRHAEISLGVRGPMVRDLGSTNGTYVNGVRVQEAALAVGDLVQFANVLYRVGRLRCEDQTATVEEATLQCAQALLQFDQLMDHGGVIPHYQPIVDLRTGATIGHEMLARSPLEGLQNPAVMFATAARLEQECALSERLRLVGVCAARRMPAPGNLFLNTHPKEVVTPRLIASLHELRRAAPRQRITIEIHEAAVTERYAMRDLRATLGALGMELAYDDFGAGQARLDELAEVPPEVLKFDLKLIRDIDASPKRQQLVESLVRVVLDLGVRPLAEGIETQAEANICRQLGFVLAQGYFFGRPAPQGEVAVEG